LLNRLPHHSEKGKSSEQYCSIFAIQTSGIFGTKDRAAESAKTAEAGNICFSKEAPIVWQPAVRHRREIHPRKHCTSLMPVPETHGKRSS
jgi:hypothetical protein